MANPFAAAVAGHVLKDLRVLGREVIDLLENRSRPGRLERDPRQRRKRPRVRFRRQGRRGRHLGRWSCLEPPGALGPAVTGRKYNERAGEAGRGNRYQLVNHGVSIVTDFRIGLER